MTTASYTLPLHLLNTNKHKRPGDRNGWPIQRDLTSQGLDIKQRDK